MLGVNVKNKYINNGKLMSYNCENCMIKKRRLVLSKMNSDETISYIFGNEDASDVSHDENVELTLVESDVDDTIDGEDVELAILLEQEVLGVGSAPEILVNSSQVNTPTRRGRPSKPKSTPNTLSVSSGIHSIF